MSITNPLVRVDGLRKTYETITAVDGISFEIQQGEIFGLLGPNGAGKTTTISILAGILPPGDGRIELAGREFRSTPAMKRLLGVVPQELAIYPKLTGRENLEFFGALYALSGQALQERVDRMLTLVGLHDRGGSRAETYSGGMKRRLNLAVGLMHNPQLLLLDEPTVGVDPQSRNHIFEGVRELNRQGLTILYTSHYMEEVQALCDRVGIMDRGRLVACDTVPNLIAGQGKAIIEVGLDTPAPSPELIEQLSRVDFVSSVQPQEPTASPHRSAGIGAAGSELDATLHLDGVAPVAQADALPEDSPHCTLLVRTNQPNRTLPGLVSVLNAANVSLRSLNIKQPNLEDVFLALTGKTLRD
jgi:ABC-2 type transport system ATP-binding protein